MPKRVRFYIGTVIQMGDFGTGYYYDPWYEQVSDKLWRENRRSEHDFEEYNIFFKPEWTKTKEESYGPKRIKSVLFKTTNEILFYYVEHWDIMKQDVFKFEEKPAITYHITAAADKYKTIIETVLGIQSVKIKEKEEVGW